MRKTIQVEIADVVEIETSIEGEVENDSEMRLGQGHTLWFDLEPFDFEWPYGYTRCDCIRRDLDHEEIGLLLHKIVYLRSGQDSLRLHIGVREDDVEMTKQVLNKQMGKCRRRIKKSEVEAAL